MTTLETLQEILAQNFPLQPGALQPEAKLADLDIDSLSIVEVLFEVEDRFGITVPSDSASMRNQLKTVGDLRDYVDGLIVAQRPAPAATGAPT